MKTRLLVIAALLASPLTFAQGNPAAPAATPATDARPGPGMQHRDGTMPRHGQHGHGPHASPRGEHGQRLLGADTNKDGVISRDEAQAQFNQRFDRLDANKDGKITPEEMRQAHETFRKEHAARREAALTARFQQADANQDGGLTRDEAQTAMPRLINHFDRIDANRDGKITAEELRNARPQRGPHGMHRDGARPRT